MRPALVPVKNIKIEVPKKRREEAELLAAGHAAGAVELGGTCKTCTTASACPLEYDTAQEGLEPTSSGAADSLTSPSPSVPLHDNQRNGADFSMDLDPVLPPPGLVDNSSQPDRGLPTFNIDDGLIQPRETGFHSP